MQSKFGMRVWQTTQSMLFATSCAQLKSIQRRNLPASSIPCNLSANLPSWVHILFRAIKQFEDDCYSVTQTRGVDPAFITFQFATHPCTISLFLPSCAQMIFEADNMMLHHMAYIKTRVHLSVCVLNSCVCVKDYKLPLDWAMTVESAQSADGRYADCLHYICNEYHHPSKHWYKHCGVWHASDCPSGMLFEIRLHTYQKLYVCRRDT